MTRRIGCTIEGPRRLAALILLACCSAWVADAQAQTSSADSAAASTQGTTGTPAPAGGSTATGASTAGSTSTQSTGAQSQSGGGVDLQAAANAEQDPYAGSIVDGKATDEVLQLSLDDAVARGINTNYALTQARIQQRQAEAQTLESLDPLLPAIKANASTGVFQFNLVQFGFTPAVLPQFASLIPVGSGGFKSIVRVDVTQAQATYDETLFDLNRYTRYKAAKVLAKAAYYNTQSSRGLVVLNVGNAYLQCLAYASQIENQAALLKADQVLLNQAVAEHEAGVVARIDELRAHVQYQAQQQVVIAAQNQYDKSLIALKRRIGVPIDQKIQLTDTAPFADLEAITPEEAKRQAFQSRQDYQGLQQQIHAAVLNSKAARYERLPTIDFNGNYGITGETHGLYHGTFIAMGTLSIPIFKEAQFRGDAHVADANLHQLGFQFDNLKEQIDQQLRDSLLDVQTAVELVRVARSNVELSTKEVEQANDRFVAGVSDNLPVVQAESTLAAAQTQLVNSTLQFNEAKLGLARNLGIVDTNYKAYLQGK